MPLVKAQCPNCGAALEVDNTKDAAICKHCGTPFIVEKAINNYNINNTYYVEKAVFNQETEESFLNRGITFIELKESQKAFEVFTEFSTKYPANYKSWLGLCISEYLLHGKISEKSKKNTFCTIPEDMKGRLGEFEVYSEEDEKKAEADERSIIISNKTNDIEILDRQSKKFSVAGVFSIVVFILLVFTVPALIVSAYSDSLWGQRNVTEIVFAVICTIALILVLVWNVYIFINQHKLRVNRDQKVNQLDELKNGAKIQSESLDKTLYEIRNRKRIEYYIDILES